MEQGLSLHLKVFQSGKTARSQATDLKNSFCVPFPGECFPMENLSYIKHVLLMFS